MSFRHLRNQRGFFSDYYLGSVFGGQAGGRTRRATDKATFAAHARLRRIWQRVDGLTLDGPAYRERFLRPLFRDVLGYHLGHDQDSVHGLYASAESEERGDPPLLLTWCGASSVDPDSGPGRSPAPPRRRLEAALASTGRRYGLLATGETLGLIRAEGDGPRGACLQVNLEGLAEEEDFASFTAFLRIFGLSSFQPQHGGCAFIEEVEKQSRMHAATASKVGWKRPGSGAEWVSA